MANKFRSLPDLDNGSGNTRSLRSGWDEFGNPCTKLASAGGSGAGADGFLTTLASVFLPVEANACDVGGVPDFNGKIDIDHIRQRHEFNSTQKASKFSEGIDIENLIKEGLEKKSLVESKSGDNFIKEVDMGRVIGKTNSKPTSKIRIVFSNKGEILSAYPV